MINTCLVKHICSDVATIAVSDHYLIHNFDYLKLYRSLRREQNTRVYGGYRDV